MPGTPAPVVRVPVGEAEKLDRLSVQLKRPKREIVTALLSAVDLRDGSVVLGRVDLPRDDHLDLLGDVHTLEAAAAALLRTERAASSTGSPAAYSRRMLLVRAAFAFGVTALVVALLLEGMPLGALAVVLLAIWVRRAVESGRLLRAVSR